MLRFVRTPCVGFEYEQQRLRDIFTQNGLGSPSAPARGGIARRRSGGKLPLLPTDNSSQSRYPAIIPV